MYQARKLISLFIFSLVIFSIFQFAFLYYEKRSENARQQTLRNDVSAFAQSLHLRLTGGLSALNTLESILIMEDYQGDRFDFWGGIILEANPGVSAVQLAPGGVVSFIVPIQGNEKAIGHDLLADKRRESGALKTIESRAITFVGPLRLIQSGKMAVIARKPVFRTINGEESFWGFVIVLIEIHGLIQGEDGLTTDRSVAWRLLGHDPDMNQDDGRPLIAESDTASSVTKWDVSYDITVPNGIWRMQMASVNVSRLGFVVGQTLVVALTAFFSTIFLTQQIRVFRRNETIIAEQKRANQERGQFLSILDSIPEMIYVSDLATHDILFANKKTKEIIGRDITGEKCFQAIQGRDHACPNCTKEIITSSGEPFFAEQYHPLLKKHLYTMTRTIEWTDVSKARFQLAIDITKRKQAEEALKTSEERFRQAFDNANDGVCIVALDGKFLQVNHRMSEILGYSREELEAMTVTDIAHPEDVDISPRFIERSVSGQITSSVFEKRYIHKNGSVLWGQVSSSMIPNAQGEPLHFVSHLRDVTESKRMEMALQASEQRYRHISENTGDVIWKLDLRSLRFTYVSPSVYRLRGYTPEEVMAQPVEAALTPDSHDLIRTDLPRRIKALAEGDESFRVQTNTIDQPCKDGRIVHTEVVTTVISDGQGRPVEILGVSRDITERRRAEEALRHALRKADLASQAKSLFLANMSHEIRTPLNGVIGMTCLLLDTELTETQRRYADTARISGEALLALINDILDMSKIEAGRLELERTSFALGNLLDEVRKIMRYKADEKGLRLHCSHDPDLPNHLIGDPARLRQILVNLVGNAIKFTASGEISIAVGRSADQAIGQSEEGTILLHFTVRDTGIGIPRDRLDQLFQYFSQGDASITRRFGGTGLGLAISRQLAKMMHGEMGVTSEEGQGSEFWFTARLGRGSGPLVRAKPDHLSGCLDFSQARLLLAEDNAVNRLVVQAMLKHLGIRHDIAENGLEAVHAVATTRYDLVLMDVQMPEMDGVEATQRIRTMESERIHDGNKTNAPSDHPSPLSLQPSILHRRTPIIALTAHAMAEDQKRCLDAGMDDYLTKPLVPETLRAMLEKWLDHQATDANGDVPTEVPTEVPIEPPGEQGTPSSPPAHTEP